MSQRAFPVGGVWASMLLSIVLLAQSQAEDWPQWRGRNRDGVWNEAGIIDKFESDRIELEWRVPIGPGYSGPTVADNRVFVTDRLTDPKQQERVLCFDAKSGQQLWSYAYDCDYQVDYKAGPRACVTIDDGRAYALGAMGHLHCFDDATGAVLWNRDLNVEFQIEMPIWGIAAAPLIYDDLVILLIGGKNACIVALDKKGGEERWKALADRAGYSAPILVQQGGEDVVVCWTGDSVAGLNPRSGQVHWRVPFAPKNMPIGIATPIVQEDLMFVTSFYDGSLMLRLDQGRPAVETVWKRCGADEQHTDALHSIISTPVFQDAHLYGVDSYGQLRCLRASNGDRLWEDLTATPKARWSNVHFVRNGDRMWMFNERGELLVARLSPQGFHEISRASLIDPTQDQLPSRREGVCWAHPAFADKHVFARNDKELVCASLAAKD